MMSELNQLDVLARVAEVIDSRKGGDPDKSYVARLFHKGTDAILKKVGEEATEVILAAKDLEAGGSRSEFVGEVADLWFHSMVAMAQLDVDHREVMDCLAQRFGISGLDEKAARSEQQD